MQREYQRRGRGEHHRGDNVYPGCHQTREHAVSIGREGHIRVIHPRFGMGERASNVIGECPKTPWAQEQKEAGREKN